MTILMDAIKYALKYGEDIDLDVMNKVAHYEPVCNDDGSRHYTTQLTLMVISYI